MKILCPFSTDSGTQFLLTLASERYTIYFDIGRKPGHELYSKYAFRELARFYGGPVDTLQLYKYTKPCVFRLKHKQEKNAQNRKQNVYFLMRLCKHDVISYTPVIFRI